MSHDRCPGRGGDATGAGVPGRTDDAPAGPERKGMLPYVLERSAGWKW